MTRTTKFRLFPEFGMSIAIYIGAIVWGFYIVGLFDKKYEFDNVILCGLFGLVVIVCHLGLHLWGMSSCVRGNADFLATKIDRLSLEVAELEKQIRSIKYS